MPPVVETNKQSQLLIKTRQLNAHFSFSLHFCVDYIWRINYQTISSVKCKWVTPCWLSGDRRQSGQIWEGKAISCFFAVRPLGLYLSFNVRISLMKVKVVCACSVSLGCQFFHQQGEKVDFPLQRDALFGKSRLVSFNEVSKGPDDFSTSGLFLFCTLVRRWKYRCISCFVEP